MGGTERLLFGGVLSPCRGPSFLRLFDVVRVGVDAGQHCGDGRYVIMKRATQLPPEMARKRARYKTSDLGCLLPIVFGFPAYAPRLFCRD